MQTFPSLSQAQVWAPIILFWKTLGACSSTGTTSLTINSIPSTIVSSSRCLALRFNWRCPPLLFERKPNPGATLSAISPTVDGFYSPLGVIGNCSSHLHNLFSFFTREFHGYNASGWRISSDKSGWRRNDHRIYCGRRSIMTWRWQMGGVMLEKGRKMNDKNRIKLNTGTKNGVYYIV